MNLSRISFKFKLTSMAIGWARYVRLAQLPAQFVGQRAEHQAARWAWKGGPDLANELACNRSSSTSCESWINLFYYQNWIYFVYIFMKKINFKYVLKINWKIYTFPCLFFENKFYHFFSFFKIKMLDLAWWSSWANLPREAELKLELELWGGGVILILARPLMFQT